jgi:hypothetical protein
MSRRKGRTPRRNQRPAQALPTPPNYPSKTPFEREDATKRCGETTQLAFALKAARLRFGIAHPYGDSERYDLILDCHRARLFQQSPRATFLDDRARPRLIRIQVKATSQLVDGLYRVNASRRLNGRVTPYQLSEIDFIGAYVIPEDSWFIFPLSHIVGATALLLSPKNRRKPHPNNPYREAWHLLREPDGLEFA